MAAAATFNNRETEKKILDKDEKDLIAFTDTEVISNRRGGFVFGVSGKDEG